MKNLKIYIIIIWIGTVGVAQGQNLRKIICDGSLTQLDSLVKAGLEVNKPNKFGLAMLHYAVACNKIDKIKFLVSKGANVNVLYRKQYTPLYYAVSFNRLKIVNLLIEAGAKPTIGSSPIFTAVLNENLPMVKKLLTPDTNIDAVNDRGNTALAIALRQDSKEMANFLLSQGADVKKVRTFTLKGKYVDPNTPGLKPKLFAPNFVSTESMEHTPGFSPNGKILYYTIESRKYRGGRIMASRFKKGQWTTPTQVFAPGKYREFDSFITRDGSKMFYCSNRPRYKGDTTKSVDMWMVKRRGKKWSKPIHLGNEVNTQYQDWFPTVSDKGLLVFSNGPRGKSKIYYSTLKNGQYQQGIAFSDSVNSSYQDYDPLIAPDESYVIFASRRPGGQGGADLYVSFKKEDGTWTKAKNMGKAINTRGGEFAPALSHDGKYFFYTSAGDIYWVSSKVIQHLK